MQHSPERADTFQGSKTPGMYLSDISTRQQLFDLALQGWPFLVRKIVRNDVLEGVGELDGDAS